MYITGSAYYSSLPIVTLENQIDICSAHIPMYGIFEIKIDIDVKK